MAHRAKRARANGQRALPDRRTPKGARARAHGDCGRAWSSGASRGGRAGAHSSRNQGRRRRAVTGEEQGKRAARRSRAREAVAGAARAAELRRACGRGIEAGRGRSEGAKKGRGSRARASDVAGATRARPARGHGGVRRGVWWTHWGIGGRGGRTTAHPRCRGTPARLGGATVEEEVEDGAVMRTRQRGDVGARWRR